MSFKSFFRLEWTGGGPCLYTRLDYFKTILQGIQLQMPQKEDVYQKKQCAKTSGKTIYGLSIVWYLFFCFGNDTK